MSNALLILSLLTSPVIDQPEQPRQENLEAVSDSTPRVQECAIQTASDAGDTAADDMPSPPAATKQCSTVKLRTGKGMIAAGGILQGVVFGSRVTMLALSWSSNDPFKFAPWTFLVPLIGTPVSVGSFGLLYGGMYRYGRYRAHREFLERSEGSIVAARTARWGLFLTKIASVTNVALLGIGIGTAVAMRTDPNGIDLERVTLIQSITFVTIALADVVNAVGFAQSGYTNGYNRMGWSIMVSSISRGPAIAVRGRF